MLTDPRFLQLMSTSDRSRTEPGIFVSGYAVDNEGVEEGDDDMDTDDPNKKILKAAEHGDVNTIKSLLEEDPSLVGATDRDEYTPLHRAAYNDHAEAIKLLLSHKADPTALTESGWTPLHCAACWGCARAAEVLLSAPGVDVNARTNGALTPLHLAAACTEGAAGAVAVIRLLLASPGVDPQPLSAANETPAQIARRNSAPVYEAMTGKKVEMEVGTSASSALRPPDPADGDSISQGSFDSFDSSLLVSQIEDDSLAPPPP